VNCRTANLDKKSVEDLNRNYMVCRAHFEDRIFMNTDERNKLIHNAVLTGFSFSCPQAAQKRKPPVRRGEMPVVFKRSRANVAVGHGNEDSPSGDSMQTSTDMSAATETTPRKLTLMSKLAYAQSKLARARVSLYRLKRSCAKSRITSTSSKKGVCPCTLCSDMNNFPHRQRRFIETQIRAQKFSKYGMRFTNDEKALALGLYFKSLTAYRFLRRTFHMTTERTPRSYIGVLHTGCGFRTEYVEALRKRVEAMCETEKFCIVTYDGMALKAKLQYEEHKDKIAGFVDLDEFGSAAGDVAKQALQFMVRGASTRWKQPPNQKIPAPPLSPHEESLEQPLLRYNRQ
jgi:hypothetical protein